MVLLEFFFLGKPPLIFLLGKPPQFFFLGLPLPVFRRLEDAYVNQRYEKD